MKTLHEVFSPNQDDSLKATCCESVLDRTPTHGQQKDAGDKAAGRHAQVIHSDAHLRGPEREEGGRDDGDDCNRERRDSPWGFSNQGFS